MTKRFFIFISLVLLTSLIYAKKVADLSGIAYPRNIHVDGEQIFITDYPSIYIFSVKDYHLQKKFGREGQGPGDIYIDVVDINQKEKGLQISVLPDSVLVNSEGWISYFTRDGQFKNMIKCKKRLMTKFMPIGNKYVTWTVESEEDRKLYYRVYLFDSQLNPIKEIYRYKFWRTYLMGNETYDFFAREGILYDVHDNKVFITNSGMYEFKISVFDGEGTKLYDIKSDYEKIKVTEKQIKLYKDDFKYRFKRGLEMNLRAVRFPEFFPAIRNLTAADGKLYVLTFKKEGEKSQFYIFELKGKLLKKVMLPIKESTAKDWYPYAISDGKLYQIVESEDEDDWELYITPIN